MWIWMKTWKLQGKPGIEHVGWEAKLIASRIWSLEAKLFLPPSNIGILFDQLGLDISHITQDELQITMRA